MSKLHKRIRFNLAQKMFFIFVLLIIYGCYKNGILPVIHGFYSFSHILKIGLYPILGFLIGWLMDSIFKNNCMFSNKFYGLLLSLVIPISTNLFIYLLYLIGSLLFYSFVIRKQDWDLNFVVIGKMLLILCLIVLNTYNYANLLEESQHFMYSFIDGILGHNISGVFTSNIVILLVGFLILFLDTYYKKEIPLTSYGIYLITLVFYSFLKSDMSFLLTNFFSSTILFVLIFLAPLSMFSPYSRKRKMLFSLVIGVCILPCSLFLNFYEGVYLALFLANLLLIFLNWVQNKFIFAKNKVEILKN